MSTPPRKKTISGPLLVGLMFLFASLVSLGLWTYWELHTRPFRPLTDALAAQFPGSNPRVEGGQHGMHKQTPRVLRIVLRAPFDPHQDPEFENMVQAAYRLAVQYADLSAYEVCEIHLFQQLPEQEPVLRSQRITLPAQAPEPTPAN